jgi:N,N'-diacetyllegionaminate synthase
MASNLNRFAKSLEINGRRVGEGAPCYVIAEAGVNHFGSLEKAYALVDMAKVAGADAVKFQHYRTERLVGAAAPEWRARLRSKELSDQQMLSIRNYCDSRRITFICTAHEEEALDFLDREAGVPAFKIGSGEVENWPYLANIARRGKPIILSTGMYTLEQIREAIAVLGDNGCRELAVLHCVTAYPTDPADVNLSVMQQIRRFFEGPVGYSDHTLGTAVPLAAVALGAELIEKHITIDVDVPDAQDWKVGCTPQTLAPFIADIRAIEAARGGAPKQLAAAEQRSLQWARKGLAAARAIAAGETIRPDMVFAQRPGDGLPPSRLPEIIGRRTRIAIEPGEKISLDLLEP